MAAECVCESFTIPPNHNNWFVILAAISASILLFLVSSSRARAMCVRPKIELNGFRNRFCAKSMDNRFVAMVTREIHESNVQIDENKKNAQIKMCEKKWSKSWSNWFNSLSIPAAEFFAIEFSFEFNEIIRNGTFVRLHQICVFCLQLMAFNWQTRSIRLEFLAIKLI